MVDATTAHGGHATAAHRAKHTIAHLFFFFETPFDLPNLRPDISSRPSLAPTCLHLPLLTHELISPTLQKSPIHDSVSESVSLPRESCPSITGGSLKLSLSDLYD